MRNPQYDVYPWDASTPTTMNTNRIKLNVGGLYTSIAIGYETGGSVPEYPGTDVEFTVQSAAGTTNNYSIFWNTVRIKR